MKKSEGDVMPAWIAPSRGKLIPRLSSADP
jgi:hypothetical protein